MLEKINYPGDLKNLSLDQLKKLSEEIREFLIDNVTKTGGHLSPNLGVVELTVALHKVFDAPADDIIWDVGHQSYVHKILTGRKKRFHTLRMKDGLCGYPSPAESKYDVIHAGHSSTSLSIASGIAAAKILKKDKTNTIAVIGDGAFTAGMVYEALNHIAHQNLPVIILLNDNGMSISKNVGGISRYLKKLEISHSYLHFKRSMERVLRTKIPFVGTFLITALYKIKEFVKSILIQKNFFEDLGISYYGPIDGHDLHKLVQTFKEIKNINKPIIIHVITTKGKGYKPSEDNPGKYHGISGKPAPSVAINGDSSIPLEVSNQTYSDVFGETLVEIAARDKKVVAITAAMKTGTGLKKFAELFPERTVDVGIAEQHAVDFALGLSLKGYKPVVAIYSTFLQRGIDQLIHDVGISRGKVLFCLDRAGLVPGDGETHQGIFDISYLRMIPNFTILMPSCDTEFRMMLRYAVKNLKAPACIRYPKDEAVDYPEYKPSRHPIEEGRGVLVRKGKDVIVVSTGALLGEAIQAADDLKPMKIQAEIYNLRFAKPISYNIIQYLARDKRPLLVLEEGIRNGGIAEYLGIEILKINPKKRFDCITLPECFPGVATRGELLQRFSLTADGIKNKIRALLKS